MPPAVAPAAGMNTAARTTTTASAQPRRTRERNICCLPSEWFAGRSSTGRPKYTLRKTNPPFLGGRKTGSSRTANWILRASLAYHRKEAVRGPSDEDVEEQEVDVASDAVVWFAGVAVDRALPAPRTGALRWRASFGGETYPCGLGGLECRVRPNVPGPKRRHDQRRPRKAPRLVNWAWCFSDGAWPRDAGGCEGSAASWLLVDGLTSPHGGRRHKRSASIHLRRSSVWLRSRFLSTPQAEPLNNAGGSPGGWRPCAPSQRWW